MDFNRVWTKFALEAEHEHFGMDRIATAHNKLHAELARVREDLAEQKEITAQIIRDTGCIAREMEQRTERVARRAALLARRVKDGDYEHSTDEAVAQAMREEG